MDPLSEIIKTAAASVPGRCHSCLHQQHFDLPSGTRFWCRAFDAEMTQDQREEVRNCPRWRPLHPEINSFPSVPSSRKPVNLTHPYPLQKAVHSLHQQLQDYERKSIIQADLLFKRHKVQLLFEGDDGVFSRDAQQTEDLTQLFTELMIDLREQMYRADTGAWFRADICVYQDGSFTTDFDYHNKPRLSELRLSELIEDMQRYPRHEQFLPEWIRGYLR